MSLLIRRALFSVTDKTGLVSFGRGLQDRGVVLIASDGTAKVLKQSHLHALEVADVTGFPEIMNGRVKTLHPMIHGGILMDRDKDNHHDDAIANNIDTIDIVACNLYDFEGKVAEGASDEVIIEHIDIGGVALIRSAAKNYRHVIVLVDPADYATVMQYIEAAVDVPLEVRCNLAAKAFAYIAKYDAPIASWFKKHSQTLAKGQPSSYS